jgi:hypothetical protein
LKKALTQAKVLSIKYRMIRRLCQSLLQSQRRRLQRSSEGMHTLSAQTLSRGPKRQSSHQKEKKIAHSHECLNKDSFFEMENKGVLGAKKC